MKNIICRLVGHKPPVYANSGWWSPGEQYGRVTIDGWDGMGRTHGHVTAPCARCKRVFTVVRIHIPPSKGDQDE